MDETTGPATMEQVAALDCRADDRERRKRPGRAGSEDSQARSAEPSAVRTFCARVRRKLVRDRTVDLMCADIAGGRASCDPVVPLFIRQMTTDDIPRMSPLLKAGDAERFHARLADGKLGFVGEVAGTIAHYSWISLDDEFESWSGTAVVVGEHEAYAYDGFTAPEFRGRSIYPAVLAHELRYLRGRGFQRVWIVVGTSNEPALAAARRAGFRTRTRYVHLRILGIPIAFNLAAGDVASHDAAHAT